MRPEIDQQRLDSRVQQKLGDRAGGADIIRGSWRCIKRRTGSAGVQSRLPAAKGTVQGRLCDVLQGDSLGSGD